MNKVVGLIGKAGSGKDTILNKVVDDHPEKFHKVISCTTRPPREGEGNGFEYFFLTKEEFMQKVENGDMLEYTNFNNWYYGTANSSLVADKINIGVFNPNGIRILKKNPEIDLRVYYILAKDNIRLIRQLGRETNPDVEEIIRRYYADEKDFAPEAIGELWDLRCRNDTFRMGIQCAQRISWANWLN